MSAIILSDLHAHSWTRFGETLPDGTNSRFQDLLNVLDQVEGFVRERKKKDAVTTLMLLGDLTHRRNYVSFAIYTRLCDWIARMRTQYNVDVIAVVGNHDVESSGVHSLGPLRHMGVTVIDQPTWLFDESRQKWMLFVPYMHGTAVPEAVRHFAADEQKNDRNPAWLFLHYAFDGKVLDSEYAVPSPLRKSDADAFERVVCGHVHAPSTEEQTRIIYVGAPLHFDFGDVGDRFAWLLDDDGGMTALPLAFPRFVTSTYPKIPAPPASGGFLRVLRTPRNQFRDVKKAAIEQGWRDALIVEAQVPSEAVAALSRHVMVSETMVRDYVARQYPDIDDDTRAAIIQIGLGYLRTAAQ